MKTHLVIDLMYDDTVFAGTHDECWTWASNQGFGYKVVPMTKDEFIIYNTEETK